LPLATAAVVYAVVLAVGASLLNDPDTYWHIAVGDRILSDGLPHVDPFSYTFAGKPWIAKEWLSQVIYALALRVGGWSAVAALAAGAFALSFGLLARALQRHLAPIPILVVLCAAFVLATPHALARPHLLALPVMVAWAAGLVDALDRGRTPRPALLLLMILWANLHGSFLLGLLLAGAAVLEAVVAAGNGRRWPTLRAWVPFALGAIAASCVTPYGPETASAAISVLTLGPALPLISEFRPPDFSHLEAFEIVLLAGGGLALYSGVRLPVVRVLVLLGLIHLALSSVRYAEVLGLIAPIYLAAPLALQFPALRPASSARPRKGIDLAIAGVLAAIVLTTVVAVQYLRPEPPARTTPAAALAALRAADAGPLLNDHLFGGYLIFSGVPTFIDGRAELYGARFVVAYHAAASLADLPTLMRFIDEYGIRATLLSPETPAVAWFDTQPGWRRLYSDDVAVVHVRASP
jgi:hypothetical protein